MVMLEDEEPMEDPVLSTVAEIDRGLREQAYVLWDMARLKDWDLWSLIEEAPETSTNFPSRREIDEMGRSWRVRADAKREGLQGWLSGRPKLIKRNDRSARRS